MLKISEVSPDHYAGDLLVYMVREAKKGAPKCSDQAVARVVKRVHASGDFTGKEGQTFLYYPEKGGKKKSSKRILVAGLGKEELSRELFRKAGGTIASVATKGKAKDLLVVLPEELDFDRAAMAESIGEGVLLGAYRFKKYKTKEEDDSKGELQEVFLYAADAKGLRPAVKVAGIVSKAACLARDMANEPGNLWTPGHFAGYGKELATNPALSCKVLDKAKMQQLGFGGILGVNQGSAQPPVMVVLEYKTSAKAPTLLLVGKGLTFDSGGISLKPGTGMEEMKYDMCGGAAVLCAMQAVAEAKLKGLNLVALVPATENLPGPAALKPGDIITHYGGKTVEVVNTDAEGRLILADALAYGIKKYKPDMVIDVATLTGAVVIGLGHHHTGLMSNDDALCEKIIASGTRCGEPLWRLPLGADYTKQLKSEIADLKNVGSRDGGSITAACFLKEFVGDTPWAHLDIAGTAWSFTEKSYIPKGPSGIGVRTLFDLIRNWKKQAP